MKVPIRVYNRFLDLEGEIDTYQSLQFGRSYHGVADFELHVNRYMHDAQRLNKGDIIALGKQSNKAAIILTKETALDENGKETENFKLTGYTLDGLMSRRLTVPNNMSHDRIKGNAETVMKHYIMNHFVNPIDPNRKMPHIEVSPNLKRGPFIEWESRYKNVAEELENISIKTGLGWGIFTNFKTKKLIFDVFEGNDLTQGNPYGSNPVFFSPEFETIKSQSYVDSDKDLKTVGYVGGQGEGTERKIVTVGHNTGWDRIETFIDARDVGESDEEELTPGEIEKLLKERGKEKMSEMITLRSLEAEILTPVKNISPFQYEKDFDLGDKVQVVNKSWGLTMEAPITEFKEIHEPSGFSLEATFGRSRPTIITKIEDKFDELDGVEKQELPAQIAVDAKKYTEDYAEKQIPSQPTPPGDPAQGDKWVDTSVIPNQMKLYDGENWNAVKGEKGDRGPQGPNIVDTSTSIGANWLVASHIKSLNGLNVNDQFIVDDAGNAEFGGTLKADIGIDTKNITIRRPDGAIALINGMAKQDFLISGFDPVHTTAGLWQGDSGPPQQVASTIEAVGTWLMGDIGLMRGDPQQGLIDVRDADGYVFYQIYEYTHTCRYLIVHVDCLTDESGMQMKIATHNPYNGETPIYDAKHWPYNSTRSAHTFKIDLGVPTYRVRNFAIKVINKDVSDTMKKVKFRIYKMYQTDFA